MRELNVQIQPERLTTACIDALIELLRASADGNVLQYRGETRADDDGPYINLRFAAADPKTGWSRLRRAYDDTALGPQLARSTIVGCEGKHGWDDYLLLHHYDSAQPLDEAR